MEDETSKTLETLEAIGTGLIGIQMVEHLLDISLHTVFQEESMPSAQELERLGTTEWYETLSNLVRQLRAKVDVHPDLELYLEAFRKDRNDFVHHLIEIPDFSVTKGDGQRECLRRSGEIMKANARLIKLFLAVVQFKDRQLLKIPMDDMLKSLLQDAEEWTTSVPQLFRPRRKS
jgi:hypothetical protein